CSSLVTVYADSMCSKQIASVTAQSSVSMCVDLPVSSPLGSKAAGMPQYTAGPCKPSGGPLTGAPTAKDPWTFSCMEQARPDAVAPSVPRPRLCRLRLARPGAGLVPHHGSNGLRVFRSVYVGDEREQQGAALVGSGERHASSMSVRREGQGHWAGVRRRV